MTFDELLDIRPDVRVADIIQLYLLGQDDKIYLNLAKSDGGDVEYLLTDKRIISEEWIPYYEKKILWIEEEPTNEGLWIGPGEGDILTLASLTLYIE